MTLDIDSQVEDKPFIQQEGVQYQLLRNQPAPAPGFAEQLVGLGGGEQNTKYIFCFQPDLYRVIDWPPPAVCQVGWGTTLPTPDLI